MDGGLGELDGEPEQPATSRAAQALRRRQAMRDCSDHSSMKPGEAVCEKRPPDSEKDARLAS